MYPSLKAICHLLLGCILLASCRGEEKPESLMPIVNVDEAQEITRTSAVLGGDVKTVGSGTVSTLYFRYGSSTQMSERVKCDPSSQRITSTLSQLKAGTTYYYCLEAGNGYSTVNSQAKSFTTQPNEPPSIGNIQLINQGPVSITLQYELTDSGGVPITATGFYYWSDNGEKQQFAIAPEAGVPSFKGRINTLQAHTEYTVQAYAINSLGQVMSETFRFRTEQALVVTSPGTLSETLDEEEKYQYTTLSIAGPLNGTDLRFIRNLLGRDFKEAETPGRMSVLNLADASIVEGGLSYNATRYSTTDVIGYGLFSNILYLKELILPDGIQVIEKNSLKDCSALASLQIPANVVNITPSTGCSSLTSIEVTEGNGTFSSQQGVLYKKNNTQLCWFPEGKAEESFLFPTTVQCIGTYSFQGCRIRKIDLPASIQELGEGAFHAAQIESITITERVRLIPYGAFQACNRLTSVTLGSATELLSEYCFDGCSSIQQLHIRATTPPVCQENSWTGAEELFKSCLLRVPKGSLSMYRLSNVWSRFEKIEEE